jgi:hypothetical protein
MPGDPTSIPNQFYSKIKTRLDFDAYNPWGARPNHTNINTNFIPIAGLFVKQFDYPAELKKLVEFGWKSAKTRKGPRSTGGAVMGRGRSGRRNPASPLRSFTNNDLVSDRDHMKLVEQVGAFTFRGDSRPAEEVEAADGFHPPISRTDAYYINVMAKKFVEYMAGRGLRLDARAKARLVTEVDGYISKQPATDRKMLSEYHLWHQVLTNLRLHIRAISDDSFMRGYIWTTRDIGVALGGAMGFLGGASTTTTKAAVGDGGWIYVLRVESGFMLKTGAGGRQDAAVAHLGPVKWKDVYGFRHRDMRRDESGRPPSDTNIYIRAGLFQRDDFAFRLVLGALTSALSTG